MFLNSLKNILSPHLGDIMGHFSDQRFPRIQRPGTKKRDRQVLKKELIINIYIIYSFGHCHYLY